MKSIRFFTISILQSVTSKFQIKGMQRLILLLQKNLFRENEEYNSYNDIKLQIKPDVGFHCLNILNYGGYENIKTFEKLLKMVMYILILVQTWVMCH